MDELRRVAGAEGQAKTAKRIGYSASVVSQVLKGSYRGDVSAVRQAVEGALLSGKVDCPVLGEIRANQCLGFQRQRLAATNPHRVRLHRTCPTCPNSRSGGTSMEDEDDDQRGHP